MSWSKEKRAEYNKALGLFKDSPALLWEAIDYLVNIDG